MRPVQVASVILLAVASGAAGQKGNSVMIRSAPRVQFPGVAPKDMNPQETGDIDCSSPAHWADGTMHIFFSTRHPFRSSGPDLFHLSRPSQRVSFDNEATWKMGPRWIEATHKAKDGRLYMWYHNEPPLPFHRGKVNSSASADVTMVRFSLCEYRRGACPVAHDAHAGIHKKNRPGGGRWESRARPMIVHPIGFVTLLPFPQCGP